MAVVAIIPARYESTRFPGKPLAVIGTKSMIQHVYERASEAPGIDEVLVATDDRRILSAVNDFGGKALLTSKNHATGTDRLAEVAKKMKAKWVVNVQGDLPFVRPETISRTLKPLRRDHSIVMGTAKTAIYEKEEWFNPNVVKVVTDAKGFALYFSRCPIPYVRRNGKVSGGSHRAAKSREESVLGYRHIGLYVYRRDFLLKFARLRPTPLERAERLEQLRALDYGYRIRVVEVNEPSVEVDTPEDLHKAEAYLEGMERKQITWQA